MESNSLMKKDEEALLHRFYFPVGCFMGFSKIEDLIATCCAVLGTLTAELSSPLATDMILSDELTQL